MEGVRPVLAEVQALVVPSSLGNPRRVSNGVDYNRAMLLLAVLEKRGGLMLSGCDAYVNVIGGLSLEEPAADLAAMIAFASSFRDRPVPSDLAAIGEIGLTGELRAVSALGQRLSEVRRLGFTKCLIPKRVQGKLSVPEGLDVIRVANIREALAAMLEAGNKVDTAAPAGTPAGCRPGQRAVAVLLVDAGVGADDQAQKITPFSFCLAEMRAMISWSSVCPDERYLCEKTASERL